MTKRKEINANMCPAWRDRAERILAAGDDDPSRQDWLRHSEACAECRWLQQDETRFRVRLAQLPSTGVARIAGAVMARARETRRAPLGRRDIAWWVAGSAAGVVLGLWLAAALPNGSPTSQTQAMESPVGGFSDEFDQFIGELTGVEEMSS